MLDRSIVLVGYSGHGMVVSEAALLAEMDLKYYTEKNTVKLNPFKLIYLGFEGDSSFEEWNKNYSFVLGIGDNLLRQKTANLILSNNKTIQNVIHPSASISELIALGQGNFIARNVSINPFAKIGNHCILNTTCIIEHECVIADAAHIAPGAVLAGNVSVGERSFIGANSIVKEGVIIGSDVIIGAGSVVVKNILDGKTMVGNPLREL